MAVESQAPDERWSIGIFHGDSPFSFRRHAGSNPVLTAESVTDCKAKFVADPFMVDMGDTWRMFFEVANLDSGRGEIACAWSAGGFEWVYEKIVLAEPFHLSYPYVFEHDGSLWMTPESHNAGQVRLYRLQNATHWKYECALLTGPRLVDPSPFYFEGVWYLFVGTGHRKRCTLRLFFTDNLLDRGPWTEHPKSPVRRDDYHLARPGGRVLVVGDQVIRYSQDNLPNYGTQVFAFQIYQLSKTHYEEVQIAGGPVIAPSGDGWCRERMHHVDAHCRDDGSWIAAVDGMGV